MLVALACSGGPESDPPDRAPDSPADTAPDSGDSGDDTGETGDTAPPDTGEPIDPFDRDGDGYRWDEDDCDDARDDVHPGAEEWCDPVDHDCDGEALEEGVCAKAQDVNRIEAGTWVGAAEGDQLGEVIPAGDLDGDGRDDLLVYAGYTTQFWGFMYSGVAYAVPGDSFGDDVVIYDAAFGYWVGPYGDALGSPEPAGDFDGDGAPDLLFNSIGDSYGAVVWLVPGPASAWPQEGDYVDTSAAGSWLEVHPSDCPFCWMTAGEDVDDDGLDDAVVLTKGWDDEDGRWIGGWVNVLLGRSQPLPALRWSDEEIEIEVDPEGDGSFIVDSVDFVEDLDGDGIMELVTVEPSQSRYRIIEGEVLAIADGAAMADLGTTIEASYVSAPLLSVGDWDGDGLPDLADRAVGWHDTTEFAAGVINIFSAPDLSLSSVVATELLLGRFEGEMEEEYVGGALATMPDMDGDGALELSGGRYEPERPMNCLFPSTRFLLGTQLARDVAWCLLDADEGWAGSGIASGDFNGDGYSDLSMASYMARSEAGVVHVVLGWDLPWDDPYYW